MTAQSPSNPGGAVFLSYAHEDTETAQRVAEMLRAAGVEVWFDQNELRGGDAWDQKIRRQIRDCALFVPVISPRTQARAEGYFRLEWKLAAERTHLMADGVPFLVPVAAGGVREGEALVPAEFTRVQWTRIGPDGPDVAFAELVRGLLLRPRAVPGGGVPVSAFGPAVAPVPTALSARGARRAGLRLAAAALVVAGAAAAFVVFRTPMASPKAAASASAAAEEVAADDRAVAVLPFANLSGDREQEYFADGLTEEILNTLSRERDLRVPGRASSFSFKGRSASPREIAQALRVSRLVEGSVRKSGNRVRISVTLTRAADGFSEQVGTFDQELTDIFALQDTVARAVVQRITRRASSAPTVTLTRNPEAYDAYLRGRALQTRAAFNAAEAARLYERAVELDPLFALAWARLAEARFRMYGAGSSRGPEIVASSRAAIDRALGAQPDLPEALIMRANWLRSVTGDFQAARADLARAESLMAPSAELRQAQSNLAREMSDWPEAFRLSRETLRLDPQNGDYTNAYGIGLYSIRGDFAEADRLYAQASAIQGPGSVVPFRNRVNLRRSWRGPEAALALIGRMKMDPGYADAARFAMLAEMGRDAEAREAWAVVLRAEMTDATGATPASGGPILYSQLTALAKVGLGDLARAQAEKLRQSALESVARGNLAPQVRRTLAMAEITLGRPDAARQVLGDWRREAANLPGGYRYRVDYSQHAVRILGRLGDAAGVVALLKAELAQGMRYGLELKHELDFVPVRDDPAFRALMDAEAAWALSAGPARRVRGSDFPMAAPYGVRAFVV